jgi:hypothetical protein
MCTSTWKLVLGHDFYLFLYDTALCMTAATSGVDFHGVNGDHCLVIEHHTYLESYVRLATPLGWHALLSHYPKMVHYCVIRLRE